MLIKAYYKDLSFLASDNIYCMIYCKLQHVLVFGHMSCKALGIDKASIYPPNPINTYDLEDIPDLIPICLAVFDNEAEASIWADMHGKSLNETVSFEKWHESTDCKLSKNIFLGDELAKWRI